MRGKITIIIVFCLIIGNALILNFSQNTTAESNYNEYSDIIVTNTTDGIRTISWSPDGTKIVAGLRNDTLEYFEKPPIITDYYR